MNDQADDDERPFVAQQIDPKADIGPIDNLGDFVRAMVSFMQVQGFKHLVAAAEIDDPLKSRKRLGQQRGLLEAIYILEHEYKALKSQSDILDDDRPPENPEVEPTRASIDGRGGIMGTDEDSEFDGDGQAQTNEPIYG